MDKIQIRNKTLNIPLIQGGMGIGVSLGNLAGHVMNEGGLGVISAAQPGYLEHDFKSNTSHSCSQYKYSQYPCRPPATKKPAIAGFGAEETRLI